jgi:hypothetical protein
MDCRRSALAMQPAISSSESCFYDAPQECGEALLTKKRISIGSFVRETHPIPILTATTNAKHGKHPKSNWKTLPHRDSGFKECEATPQIPNEARDNRILALEYT